MTASGLTDSWIEGWEAALAGWLRFGEHALTRGPALAGDLLRWFELTTRRRPPSWHSPHELVWEAPLARLRSFSTTSLSGRGPVPVLVLLPPQAGHDSCIVDYSREQSQMQTIV